MNGFAHQNSGARQRRIYSITDKGMVYLKQWLDEPLSEPSFREEICMRVGFGQFQNKQQLLSKLVEFTAQLVEQEQKIEKAREHFRLDHAGEPDQFYLFMNFDYAEAILKAKQQWCDKVREMIANKK